MYPSGCCEWWVSPLQEAQVQHQDVSEGAAPSTHAQDVAGEGLGAASTARHRLSESLAPLQPPLRPQQQLKKLLMPLCRQEARCVHCIWV